MSDKIKVTGITDIDDKVEISNDEKTEVTIGSIDLSKVYRLALDLGSANLKIAGQIGNEVKFKKIKSKVSLDALDTNYVVKLGDRVLCFGVGDSLIQQDKTQREYIEETILLAVNQIYGDFDGILKIDLALGLPLDLYKSQNKREYFEMKINSMLTKTLSGQVNGQDVFVKINSFKVCAEGYSGFLALHEKMDITTPFLIVDAGYRTTDILSININQEDKELIIGNFKTINTGLLEVFEDIQKKFLNDTGCNYTAEVIEDRILNAPMVKIGLDSVNMKDWIKYGEHTVKEIFKTIQLSFPDMNSRNIYPIGGGAYTINDIIEYMLSEGKINYKTEIIGTQNELIYANVAGYFFQLLED